MLTADELSRLRDVQTASLGVTALIRPRVTGQGSMGEPTYSWVDGATTVCRLARLNTRLRELMGHEAVLGDWILTLPYDTVVEEGDRVRVGTKEYQVVGMNLDEDQRTALRVNLAEVS